MKKNYILTLFLSLLISGLTFGQTLMITTISDGDCSGGVPKMVEIYVQGEVNLSLYSLKNLSISSTSGTSSLNSFGTVTDDFIYVYYDTTTPEEVFATEYPSATPSIEATVASFNGDDVIRIVRNSDQTIIDQYGDTDGGTQDGTGTPWEYKDGYAKRINGTTSSGEFTIGDWTVVNGGLDGQGSCQGGTIFEDVMGGVGVYTAPVVYDLLEDFETALPAGALVGDSGMATTPEVVADPATGGTNGDVLKIVTSAAGNGWQNAQLFLQGDLLDLTTDDKVVTVDVYSESAFMMLAKTATPSNGGAESATDASHTGSGWETLTFDFSDPKDNTPVANDIFGRILFFPQWNGAGWNDSSVTTTYVDNIKGIGYESTPPTGDNSVTIATTQAWNSYVNVFSVSDNSYQFGFGDIEVSDLRATATETSVTLEPNISIWTNESTNDAYFDQDAASQTPVAYIEASTYIENASLANNALTFSGNISTSDLGDDYTVIAFIKSLTSSYDQVAFKSVDISSTGDFTVTATAEEMSQAVIQYGFAVTGPLADPSDTTLGSVVIGAETLGIEDTDIVNVSVYPNPSNSNWNFRTPNTVITSVEVFNLLGKRVVLRKNNSTDIAISTQGLTSGIYIARITTEQGTKSVKLIKE